MRVRQSSSTVPSPLDPLVVDLAREVVAEHYSAEATLFDQVLGEFEADPARLVEGKALRAPVGMGVDLALMIPYVLAAASFLGGVVVEKTAESAVEAVRERVAKAWASRRARRNGAPEQTGGDPQLTSSEHDQIVVVVTIHLSDRGVDPAVAATVAKHVIGKLIPPAEPPR